MLVSGFKTAQEAGSANESGQVLGFVWPFIVQGGDYFGRVKWLDGEEVGHSTRERLFQRIGRSIMRRILFVV